MIRRAERERRERVAEELRVEHEQFRARLLAVLEKTDEYADELLSEIKKWNARGEQQ